jgi:prevent-host-death family protein
MAPRRWSVAAAKAHLSELVDDARRRPQLIENRGREVAVVLGIDDFLRLNALGERAAPAERLAEFLRFSARLRAAGGASLRLPRRRARPSPFPSAPGG